MTITTTPIIEIKNIGKKYNIAHQRGGYVALRDVLAYVIKKPFSFLKRKAQALTGTETKEEFWALRGVNMEIARGEVVGIIGHNGAGKSTLLKILTGITPPTEGEIILRGRVASLLEVGTGFHPELTGRENIFLNGAILGMTKKEIAKKFDAIVEFSGVAQFLDTPVKYYSSGMYVRLAFSVAAHMEPDILLVDEVLAVGDAEFQKKCLGKMEEVTRAEGRTILFVSHNLIAVERLCKKTILLEKGCVKAAGETKEVIALYLKNQSEEDDTGDKNQNLLRTESRNNATKLKITRVDIATSNNSALIKSDSKLRITIEYDSGQKENIPAVRVLIILSSQRTQHAALKFDSYITAKTLGETIAPNGRIVCETEVINLSGGRYFAEVGFYFQDASRGFFKTVSQFEIATDIDRYNYRLLPDKNESDCIIPYRFSQE